MPVNAYAATKQSGKLTPFQYEPGALGETEVEIAVSHCGICHSDLHMVNNDWGLSAYPLVPGHEIVGTIIAKGAGVKHLDVGDRVGVGWLAGTCMECEWCRSGLENVCSQWQPTCVGRHGGFADRVRADGRWAFRVPKGLDSADAAPLMCGGATVFTPLKDHDVGRGTRVGIVSLGGLGHLGVLFAKAMGAEVTVFSTTPEKSSQAKLFGASRFVVLGDTAAMEAAANSLDVILTTASADLPWAALVNTLRPKGKLVLLGVPQNAVSFDAFPMIAGFRQVVGSNTGSRKRIEEMLDFAAKHKISPVIERYPMAKVNDALERLAKNEVRYRAVLEA